MSPRLFLHDVLDAVGLLGGFELLLDDLVQAAGGGGDEAEVGSLRPLSANHKMQNGTRETYAGVEDLGLVLGVELGSCGVVSNPSCQVSGRCNVPTKYGWSLSSKISMRSPVSFSA